MRTVPARLAPTSPPAIDQPAQPICSFTGSTGRKATVSSDVRPSTAATMRREASSEAPS